MSVEKDAAAPLEHLVDLLRDAVQRLEPIAGVDTWGADA
jgi:hypothetical protein